MDLNQLYSDHQFLLMRAERASCPERRQLHLRGAAQIAGRIGHMQGALDARAAQSWAEAAQLDRAWTGHPPQPPRGPQDRRGVAEGAVA